MNKKYYKVTCKCGHVGKDHYVLITFGIIAKNGKEAANKARAIPRCKHHHKDCIREVRKISYQEFLEINKVNNNDPYLKCSSIQDQRCFDLTDRLIEERHPESAIKEESHHKVFSGKTKIRSPKKFVKFNYADERNVLLNFLSNSCC